MAAALAGVDARRADAVMRAARRATGLTGDRTGPGGAKPNFD